MSTRGWADLDAWELLLLRAARESGALDALLSSAGTTAEVAEQSGITDRAARIVVEALADMGFVQRVGNGYEPTNRALGFLTTRDPRSVGPLPHALDLLEYHVTLPVTMHTGDPPAKPVEWTRHELGAHAATDEGTVRACATGVQAAAPGAETALELCGRSGVVAAELADRGLDTALVDDPDVVRAVEPMLADRGVTCEPGSLADLGDRSVDLVYGVDLAWSLGPAENRMLVAAAADVLKRDGTLVLLEPLADRSAAATETAVRALATGYGECYAAGDLTAWCEAAGLESAAVEDVPDTPFQAVSARRSSA